MANRYYSAATGNWSTLTNWDGSTYPTTGDIVYASGKTITIDTGITVTTITTAQYPGGSVAGGSFTISTNTGLTINANISAGTTTCLTTSHNGGVIRINGSIYGGTVTGAHGITHSGLGTLSISGNVTGGTVGTMYGINITSTGGINLSGCPSIYITGNTSGGTIALTTYAVNAASTTLCLVDITGDCVAGTQCPGVYLANQNSLLIVRGNLISTSGYPPFYGFNVKCSPSTSQSFIYQDTSVSSANTTFSTSAYTYGMPDVSNVRSGVKYGYLSGLTGTMVIPPFSAVSVGIPVDNGSGTTTYGTAIIGIRDIGNMLAGYIG